MHIAPPTMSVHLRTYTAPLTTSHARETSESLKRLKGILTDFVRRHAQWPIVKDLAGERTALSKCVYNFGQVRRAGIDPE